MDLLIIGLIFTVGSIVLLVKESHGYKAKQPKTFAELKEATRHD